MEVLRLTGFNSYKEFMSKTDHLERKLIVESISQWHSEQDGSVSSSGGRL